MKVAQLRDGETIEGGRKALQGNLYLLKLNPISFQVAINTDSYAGDGSGTAIKKLSSGEQDSDLIASSWT